MMEANAAKARMCPTPATTRTAWTPPASKAQEVGGHDESRSTAVEKSLDLRPQTDQGPEQTVREQQQSERREQRCDGGEGLTNEHRAGLNRGRDCVTSMVVHRYARRASRRRRNFRSDRASMPAVRHATAAASVPRTRSAAGRIAEYRSRMRGDMLVPRLVPGWTVSDERVSRFRHVTPRDGRRHRRRTRRRRVRTPAARCSRARCST